MIEAYRDEHAITDFQSTMAAKYAAGEVEEFTTDNGLKVGTIVDGQFKMVDTYREGTTEPDETGEFKPFVGRTVISVDGVPVWFASYDTTVTDPDALDFYYEGVMGNPDPDMPLFGVDGLEDEAGRFVYTKTSLLDNGLYLASYMVQETMTDELRSKLAYNGRTQGGWLT